MHSGIGLAVPWRQPSPGTQLLGPAEAGHVTDLGDEDRGEDRADPVDGLHRPVARIAGQLRRGPPAHHVDLEIQRLDQPAQRDDPGVEGRIQPQIVEQLPPATPNRSDIGTRTPCLASTAWTCALSPDRNATSFARCRTASRNSRTAGGAIHASGSRPIRSRSAKSRRRARRS